MTDKVLNLLMVILIILVLSFLGYGGWSYGKLQCQYIQLQQSFEELRAEKLLLETIVDKDEPYSIINENQGWINPTSMEN